ncbi:hypothetical protein PF003_g37124 [Phytophthora fragariae]|nr:hypothetical protein PF003_g37124 [Phytophthora fragariae]
MARTHKTAHIKAQMAERARQEEEARSKVVSARTRSQRSQALQDARDSRASQSGPMRPQKALHPLVMMPMRRKTRKRSKRKKRSLKKRKKMKKMQTKKIHVARRNADLRKQVRFQGLPDSEIPLVPDKWEPYQRKYICTHGWKERERSTGKRTSHKLRRTECPFQMLAQVVMRRGGTWGIVMKREVYSHNHPISDGIYRSYPDIRQVPVGSALMPGIELLVDADAGTSSIYNYIRENSNHCVTMDDVRNLVARMHKKGKLSL